MRLPKVRWKTLRTIWLCRTMALFVGGAAPVAVVEAEPLSPSGASRHATSPETMDSHGQKRVANGPASS